MPMRRLRAVLILSLSVATAVCGGEAEADGRSELDAGPDDPSPAAAAPAEEVGPTSSSVAEARPDEPLCDVIDDDEALTPAGAEPIDIPGVGEANNERRCLLDFGVDMPIEEVRGFYRSTLADRGFEMDHFIERDGIARGNLSRTMIRATQPGLQVNVTVDEFDPSQTPIAEYRVQGKVQIDAMRQ